MKFLNKFFLIILLALMVQNVVGQKFREIDSGDTTSLYILRDSLANYFVTPIAKKRLNKAESRQCLIDTIFKNMVHISEADIETTFRNENIQFFSYQNNFSNKKTHRSFAAISKEIFFKCYINIIIYDDKLEEIRNTLNNKEYTKIANQFYENLETIEKKIKILEKLNFSKSDTVINSLKFIKKDIEYTQNYIAPDSALALKIEIEKRIFEFESDSILNNRKYYLEPKRDIGFHKITNDKEKADYLIKIEQSNTEIKLTFFDKNNNPKDEFQSDRHGITFTFKDDTPPNYPLIKGEKKYELNNNTYRDKGSKIFIPYWKIGESKEIKFEIDKYIPIQEKLLIEHNNANYDMEVRFQIAENKIANAKDQDVNINIKNFVTGDIINSKIKVKCYYTRSFPFKFLGMREGITGSHTAGNPNAKSPPIKFIRKFKKKKVIFTFEESKGKRKTKRGTVPNDYETIDNREIELNKKSEWYNVEDIYAYPKFIKINAPVVNTEGKKISNDDYSLEIIGVPNTDGKNKINNVLGKLKADIPYDIYVANNHSFTMQLIPKKNNLTLYNKLYFTFPDSVEEYKGKLEFTPAESKKVKLIFFDSKTRQPIKNCKFKLSAKNTYTKENYEKELEYQGDTIEHTFMKGIETFRIQYNYNSTTKIYEDFEDIYIDFYKDDNNIYIYTTSQEIDSTLKKVRDKYRYKEKFCITDTVNIAELDTLLKRQLETRYLSINPVEHFALEAKLNIIKYFQYNEKDYIEKAIKAFENAKHCVYSDSLDNAYVNNWLVELNKPDLNIEDCLEAKRKKRNNMLSNTMDSSNLFKNFKSESEVGGDTLILKSTNIKILKENETYDSGVYYDELFIEYLGELLQNLADSLSIRPKDLTLEGTIYGETDPQQVGAKGIFINKKYVGSTTTAEYRKASSTARKIKSETKKIIDNTSPTWIIVGKGRIFTNPELAFYRAWVVINKFKQMQIGTEKINIITISADEGDKSDKNRRKTTIDIIIILPKIE